MRFRCRFEAGSGGDGKRCESASTSQGDFEGCLGVGLGVALEALPLRGGAGKRIAEALFLSYEGLAGDILAPWDFK